MSEEKELGFLAESFFDNRLVIVVCRHRLPLSPCDVDTNAVPVVVALAAATMGGDGVFKSIRTEGTVGLLELFREIEE